VSEEHSDSPPIHETEQEEHVEQEGHSEEFDLIHEELGEAVAATRKAPAPPNYRRRRKPAARGKSLGFLGMERLPSDRRAGNAPIAVWIVVQLAAIGAAAGRWKFWATAGVGSAPSVELLALDTLVVVQLLVSTLIYPILLDSWTKLAWSAATVIAFDAIAWVMTDVAPLAAFWAGAFAVAWVIGLALWRSAVRGAFATMLVRLVLALVVLGWPIVMYLHGEFGGNSSGSFAGVGGGGPIVIGVEQLSTAVLARQTWVAALALVGTGGAAWVGGWLLRRQPTKGVWAKERPANP
jgi:hypothetical protein